MVFEEIDLAADAEMTEEETDQCMMRYVPTVDVTAKFHSDQLVKNQSFVVIVFLNKEIVSQEAPLSAENVLEQVPQSI